jgi:hypothetical protein
MSATSFDVRAFNRRTDVATALLTAIDAKELQKREMAVADREREVARRERAIDRLERLHELKGTASASGPTILPERPEGSPEHMNRRFALHEKLRWREREWWSKVLGCVPSLP